VVPAQICAQATNRTHFTNYRTRAAKKQGNSRRVLCHAHSQRPPLSSEIPKESAGRGLFCYRNTDDAETTIGTATHCTTLHHAATHCNTLLVQNGTNLKPDSSVEAMGCKNLMLAL